MIDREHELPIKRQAELLAISRGSVYYQPEPVSEADLRLMRRIDELHLEHPFAGARMQLRDILDREGVRVGRRHVGTLMKRMGIQALYRKPNTSKKHPAHPVFPYLLRDKAIERANQAWALDITYIPMARGWVYLVAVLDNWHSRRTLAHRVSITMEAAFCVEALNEAVARYGPPEIANTDQGSQFSSLEFVDAFDESDEGVVDRWSETPVWQYFVGSDNSITH
jgi:putative transposase